MDFPDVGHYNNKKSIIVRLYLFSGLDVKQWGVALPGQSCHNIIEMIRMQKNVDIQRHSQHLFPAWFHCHISFQN